VDLFVHAPDTLEASRIARRIFYALAADNERWVILRNAGTITMHKWNESDLKWTIDQKVQVILRMYKSPAEVLYGFDVDCCACAYDGRQVWVTPRCLRAIRTGLNVLNPLHASPRNCYEIRLAKYATRGYAVQVAGIYESRIDRDNIQANAIETQNGLAGFLKIAYAMEKGSFSAPDKETLYHSDLRGEAVYGMSPYCETFIRGRESYADNDSFGIIVPSVIL
jgi:hypothetical protein